MRGCIPVITALNIWHYDSPAAIFNGFWLVSICLWKFFGIYPDFAIGCGVCKRKHSLSEISMKRDVPPVSREVWNIVKGVTNTTQKDNQDQFCDCRWKNLHKQNISQFRSRKLTGNILGGESLHFELICTLIDFGWLGWWEVREAPFMQQWFLGKQFTMKINEGVRPSQEKHLLSWKISQVE